MSQSPPLLRVRDWDGRYENNRSREMKRTEWFPAPNDLSDDGYVQLVSHPEGAAHLGIWHAVLMVASRARPRRGLLIKENGGIHTSKSLALVTRLPEPLVKAAIDRLLEIGLLEVTDDGTSESNNLSPHPDAGIPQGNATRPQHHAAEPQEGAVEEKGTEHHHQGNRNEQKGTEPQGRERRDDSFKIGRSDAYSGEAPIPRSVDDVDDRSTPQETYASPEDELKAVYLHKTGEHITSRLLDAIRLNLELNQISVAVFVDEVKKHVENHWRNPAGFLRDLSKRFREATRPASAPVTAAEAAEQNYKCQFCGSRTPGEGARLVGSKFAPCTCASEEYIARQRRPGGLFAQETIQ